MSNYYIQKIMNSLFKNNLYIDTDTINLIDRKNMDILFLNKKRKFDQSLFCNSFNNIIPNKEIDFAINRKNEAKRELNESFSDPTNLIEPSEDSIFNNCNDSNSKMQRLIEIEKFFKNLIDITYNSQNQTIKDNNILKHSKDEKIINSQKTEKINPELIFYNKYDKINNFDSNKNNIFNITNIDYNRNGVKEKKSDRFESGDKNNCHEIKVMKNNKVVYINSNLDNSFSPSKNLKKLNKIIFIDRGKRGSKYRGVSRNGNQWQVLIMLHKSKSYVGTYSTEEIAARIYDILAIKYRGVKARTNFIYNDQQIKKICSNDIDLKSKNINEDISNLLRED